MAVSGTSVALYGLPIVSRTRTREPGTNVPLSFGTMPYTCIVPVLGSTRLSPNRNSPSCVKPVSPSKRKVNLAFWSFNVRQHVDEASASSADAFRVALQRPLVDVEIDVDWIDRYDRRQQADRCRRR